MSVRTNYSWFWPAVDTIASARSARMWGFWAVIISGGLTSLITVWSLQTNRDIHGFQANEWSLMVIPISATIAIGIYKENRVAAVFGLIWYFAGQIPSFVQAPEYITKFSIIATCVVVMSHIASIRANFALYHHRLQRDPENNFNVGEGKDLITESEVGKRLDTPEVKASKPFTERVWLVAFLGFLVPILIFIIAHYNASNRIKNNVDFPPSGRSIKDQDTQRKVDLIMGLDYDQTIDKEMLERYISYALNGNCTAQIELGKYYSYGKKTPVNYEEAEKYFKMAASSGNKEAQFCLGDLKARSTQTMREAAGWYRKAGEQGHVQAQAELARLLRDGRGIEKNSEEAYVWFSLAESMGGWVLDGQQRRELEKQLTAQQLKNAQAKTSALYSKMNTKP